LLALDSLVNVHCTQNDDIAFPPGALRNIAARVWSRVRTRPMEAHFKFWYQHGATGWSCFALAARAVQRVGTFDENLYPVYFEDQDYEWRLERAGLLSVHIRDVLVVHGSEDAEEYESGSMTALVNATGGADLRAAFKSWLVRGDNRAYMRAKWGGLKPSGRPGDDPSETRWNHPFNRPELPLSWWKLDDDRRRCILFGSSDDQKAGADTCLFNGMLAHEAAMLAARRRDSEVLAAPAVARAVAAGKRSFASRLSASASAAARRDPTKVEL
jgi:hypothetical protein